MKKIILIIPLLIVWYSLVKPQSVIQSVMEFKISTDNEPSTFIQNMPKLLYADGKKFLTLWNDSREGYPSIYAQWFDSSGNSIRSNFKINAGGKFVFQSSGYYLGVREYGYTSGIDGYIVDLKGIFFDENNGSIIWRQLVDAFDVTLYEMNWFEKGYDIANTSEDYIFAAAYHGNRTLTKYSSTGAEIKNIFWNTNTIPVSSSVGVNNKDEYMIVYFNENNQFYPNIFPPGIYASFYSKNDSLLARDVIVKEYGELEGIYWFNQSYLPYTKVVNIEDSLFQVFWIYKDSVDLNFAKFDGHGNRIGDIQTETLLHTYLEGDEERTIRNFTFSNFFDNKFSIFITLTEGKGDSLRYNNTLLYVDYEGSIVDIKYEQSLFLTLGKQIFYSGDKSFYTVTEDSSDIFLFKLNEFNIIDRKKINDDKIGSNDVSPKIVSVDTNTNFVTWETETKIKGQKIDLSGSLLDPPVVMVGKNYTFSDDGRCIVAWKIKTEENLAQTGYSIFDRNWNLLKDTVLNSSQDFYSHSTSVDKVNNIIFINCTEYGVTKKIIALDNNFDSINEIAFSGNKYHSLRLLKNDDESVWFAFSNVLQLYSNHLEALTPEYNISAHLYLGSGKFLYTFNTKQYSGYPFSMRDEVIGRILTASGDVIKNDFYLASDVDEYAFAAMLNNDFLLVYMQNNKIFARVFSDEGLAKTDSIMVHSDIFTFRKHLSITLNQNKVFCVWSELHNPEFGYDIYGSVFDISLLVSVDKNETDGSPESFYLFQNYPNPFNSTTKIKYTIPPVETGHAPSLLRIYDILGREIATLVNEEKPSGNYEVTFDASNLSPKGSMLTSGVYYFQLRAGGFVDTKKMILLK